MKRYMNIFSICIICMFFISGNTRVFAFSEASLVIRGSEDEFYKHKVYSNPSYKVILRYPKRWTPNFNYGSIDNIPLGYQGEDGYFILGAIGENIEIDEIIKNEAFHKASPYGTSPKIERIEFKGNEGAFIFPSEDQQPSMKNQSAFIVKYPKSVVIEGNSYSHLIIYSDKNNIRSIIDTLILLK